MKAGLSSVGYFRGRVSDTTPLTRRKPFADSAAEAETCSMKTFDTAFSVHGLHSSSFAQKAQCRVCAVVPIPHPNADEATATDEPTPK